MKSRLEKIRQEAMQALESATNSEMLFGLEKKFLGRKAELAEISKKLVDLAETERPAVGRLINDVKRDLSAIIQKRKEELGGDKQAKAFDHTLPGIRPNLGYLHPVTQFLRQVEDIFVKMGYEVVEGPELESQAYNFDLLNMPEDHPSRDIQDTFYIDKTDERKRPYVLRTQTSPVQIRAMLDRKPPVRLIAPGRVYRNERTDASHETTFTQCEGLVIDKDIRITDLIGTVDLFVKRLYGEDARIQVRPHFFPFTEPSLEVDMNCLICKGKGCASCKHQGWIEILGAGMVHPQVLKNMGVDPKVYTGFAFGLGIDRFVMQYYRIDDIRLLYSGDLRFLEQF